VQPFVLATCSTDGAGAVDIRRFVAGLLCSYSIVVKESGDVLSARRALEEAVELRGLQSVRPAYLLAKLTTSGTSATTASLEAAALCLGRSVAACRERLDQGLGMDDSVIAINEAQTLLEQLRTELRVIRETMQRRCRNAIATANNISTEGTASSSGHSVGDVASESRQKATALDGTWFTQAEQCRHVISQLFAEGRTQEAECMRRDLQRAACNKVFREAILPQLDLSVPMSPNTVALAALVEINLEAGDVRAELRRLRDEYFCGEAVDRMNPLQVEMSLMRAGLLETGPVIGVAGASPCPPTVLAGQQDALKRHRRRCLPAPFA
jgi:hypothetical protein